MASCVRCSKENAEYEMTYLVITKDTAEQAMFDLNSGDPYTTANERLEGSARFGICEDCHGKSAKATVRTAASVSGAMGVLLSVGSHLNIFLVLGIGIGAALIGTGFSYLYCYKFSQQAQARDEITEHIRSYYTSMGPNRIRVFVPLAKGMYGSERSFRSSNRQLSKEMAEKLYNGLIANGAWEEYVETHLLSN